MHACSPTGLPTPFNDTGVAICSYITPVLIHFLLWFGKARCMRVPPPGPAAVELAGGTALEPAAVGAAAAAAAEKDAEAGEGAEAAPTDATDGSSDGGLAKATGNVAVAVPSKGGSVSSMHVPHPDAPAGLFYAYRKQRCHTLWLLAYDFVLPILVVALGCFFSVTTLVLLFQPGGEE
jgi:hypothetical protein